jgi:hypothetical protein
VISLREATTKFESSLQYITSLQSVIMFTSPKGVTLLILQLGLSLSHTSVSYIKDPSVFIRLEEE